MYSIEVEGSFSAAHVIEGEALHGHNFKVAARVYGELNENYMVIDFNYIKKVLEDICKELDHKTIIALKSNSIKVTKKDVEFISGGKFYSFPKEDASIIPTESTTAEQIAKYIHTKIKEKIKNRTNIKIYESKCCSAEYIEL